MLPCKKASTHETVTSSALLPRHMIKYNHLDVLVSLDVTSLRVVPRFTLGIHVDYLPIPLVLEQQPLLVIRNDLEVWAIIVRRMMSVPIEEGQIRGSWQQTLLALEESFKVIFLQAMPIIYVPRDLLTLNVLVADEDDSAQLTIPHQLFTCSQIPEEWERGEILLGTGQHLWCILQLGTFRLLSRLSPCCKFFARQDLALPAANLHQLSCKFVLFKVKAILWSNLSVQVILICREALNRVLVCMRVLVLHSLRDGEFVFAHRREENFLFES